LGTPETDTVHAEEDEIAHKLIPEVDVIKEEPAAASPSQLVQRILDTTGNGELA